MTAVSAALMPAIAGASPWQADPNIQLPDEGYVSQKVELVDINADGYVDIVFANSSGDNIGNDQNAQPNQLLINNAGAGFTEQGGLFDDPDNAYAIKAGDLDNDGDADLVVGVNFTGQSYVLINEGNNTFTPQNIAPAANKSIGDVELGDVDGDGNLDILATDWGTSQPYGDPVDQGGPMHLWLGNGDGTFANGDVNLPMGMSSLAAWGFDLELVDINNDYALDAMVSTRGVGFALVLMNDGNGTFSKLTVMALESNIAKQVNVAFTPMDFTGDGWVDIITLQDGVGQGGNCVDIMGVQYCAKRNSVLINDGAGGFADNPAAFWDIQYNPAKLDFDAATLDFDNNMTPDFVVTGLRLGPNDKNSRLFLNNGAKFTPASVPMDAAFPVVPELAQSFGVMFADFNRDGREDAAVAQRHPALPNYVLFGRDDPADGIAADTTPPRIYDDNIMDKLGTLLYFGQDAGFMARVNDYKTPTHWHDHLYDDQLDTYNLTGDGAAVTAHKRRLPYMEFALSLVNPDDIKMMPDGDPKKFISPSIWFGEALWRVGFTVPYNGMKEDTLTWQYCAIDAANNKTCVGPFSVDLKVDPADCGNGMVEPWETCDDPADPTCIMCEETCGDGVCTNPPENPQNCPEDCDDPGPCDHDGICEPPEDMINCPDDCDYGGFCGDDICQNPPENEQNCPEDCIPEPTEGVCGDMICSGSETIATCPEDCAVCGDGICTDPPENMTNCPEDCDGGTATNGECPDTAGGADGQCQLDDDGCGCVAEPDSTRGLWASLLLFGVFGVRRFRRRA